MNTPDPTQSPNTDPQTWLQRHGDALYRYALRRTGQVDVAEDLVQETLLAAWKARASFRGDAKELTWLTSILRNKLSDHLHRREREDQHRVHGGSEALEVDEIEALYFADDGHWRGRLQRWQDDPLQSYQVEAFRTVVELCSKGMTEQQREAFRLCLLGELDVAEACAIMEVKRNHLYVLLHRARLSLRQCLELRWQAAGPGGTA